MTNRWTSGLARCCARGSCWPQPWCWPVEPGISPRFGLVSPRLSDVSRRAFGLAQHRRDPGRRMGRTASQPDSARTSVTDRHAGREGRILRFRICYTAGLAVRIDYSDCSRRPVCQPARTGIAAALNSLAAKRCARAHPACRGEGIGVGEIVFSYSAPRPEGLPGYAEAQDAWPGRGGPGRWATSARASIICSSTD